MSDINNNNDDDDNHHHHHQVYRLKTIRYLNYDRKILLQNVNGPCPLLAAANALLLRGTITLPPSCIRNGIASLHDVVNVLGMKAMNNPTLFSKKNTDDSNSNDNNK